MAYEVTIQLTNSQGAAEVRAGFTDEEWARLVQFADEAETLRLSDALSQGLSANLSIRWDAETGLHIANDGTLVSRDTLGLLLHRLRPLILRSESTYFCNITSILCRRISNPTMRQLFHRMNDCFLGREFEQSCGISVSDLVLNRENELQNWLNAVEYHRDPLKQKQLENLALPLALLDGVFHHLLVDKVRAIMNVAHLVRGMQQKRGVPLAATPFR